MKIIVVTVLFVLISFIPLFSAPLMINPVPLNTGGILIYLASDVYIYSNDINSLFTVGARYGLSDDMEIGLRLLATDFEGVMGDFKIRVLKNDPFTVTADAGIGFTAASYVFNTAFYLDTMIDDNFSIYIVARGTYPASDIIDLAYYPAQGFQFSPRVGIELFRTLNFSLIMEGGVVITWYSRLLDYNASALAGIKL